MAWKRLFVLIVLSCVLMLTGQAPYHRAFPIQQNPLLPNPTPCVTSYTVFLDANKDLFRGR
jgi:hypothetical protein